MIGFHDDGSVTIGPPEYKGYQVIVLDNAGSKKQKEINVAGFNRLPEEGEVTAFSGITLILFLVLSQRWYLKE